MMSQTLLKKILCSEACEDVDKIINFLYLFKQGNYIYPSVFKRNLNYSVDDTYRILMLLAKNNILKMIYIVECFTCNRKIVEYEEYNKIDELFCDECDESLSFPDNVKVAYKVIVEWKK